MTRKPGRRPVTVQRTTTERPRAMTKRIRILLASIGIVAAAAAGLTLTTNLAAAPPDTTWGAHTTVDDTTWGSTPQDVTGTVEDATGVTVTPLDTTWG